MEASMAHALNMTLPIKQDAATLEKLKQVKAVFATQIQPKIDEALRNSKIVHFARVVVIDDKYLQVITEYDGEHKAYTEFFRRSLPDVFATLFSLAELPPGTPSFDKLDANSFFELAKGMQRRSLGESADGSEDVAGNKEGYLFSAYRNKTVKDILPKVS
jgi:hypothetical protein